MVHLICPDCYKTDFGQFPHQKDVIKHAHRIHKLRIAPNSIRKLRKRQERVWQALKEANDGGFDKVAKESKQCWENLTLDHPTATTNDNTNIDTLHSHQKWLTSIYDDSNSDITSQQTLHTDPRGADVKARNEAFAANTKDYEPSLRYHANNETARLARKAAVYMEMAKPGDALGLWFCKPPDSYVYSYADGDRDEEDEGKLFKEDFPALAKKGEALEE